MDPLSQTINDPQFGQFIVIINYLISVINIHLDNPQMSLIG
jgi:hypothetical protein